MLLVLTFDLHKPYPDGQPHGRVTKALKEIGFVKTSPRKGITLPANTYTKEEDCEVTFENMKKLRTKTFRQVKRIINREHGGSAVVFLSVGGYWGTRVG